MARKRKRFDLRPLSSISADIRMPSLALNPPRLEGFGYRFTLVLPLLSESGEAVFSVENLQALWDLFSRRCGGCLGSSSVSNPAWFGSYLPPAETVPVKDYHTLVIVYTKQIDAADRFFQMLKNMLKKAGLQEEVLIERVPVWLVGSVNS